MKNLKLALLFVALSPLTLSGCSSGDSTNQAPADASSLDIPEGLDTGAPPSGSDAQSTPTQADTDSGADSGTTDVEPPAIGGLGIDYDALEVGVLLRYAPGEPGLTALPWPSDERRLESGAPDLSTFPNPGVETLTQYIDYATTALGGWGLNGAIFFEFEGPLDLTSLPTPAFTKGSKRAALQLVNVTEGSPREGERLPLEAWFYDADATAQDPYLEANTLAIRPVSGFPLAEAEVYCAVVTREVLDAEGRHLGQAPGLKQALSTAPAYEPLRVWLETSALRMEDIAAATCFTTDSPTAEMRRIRSFIFEQPAVALTDAFYMGTTTTFREFQGTYVAPNYQVGDKPYESQGGQITFDEAGDPIVQAEEEIRFVMMVPTIFGQPEGGWPVVLYAHGTGGDYLSCKSGINSVAADLIKSGMALICIEQPLHGARGFDDNPNWFLDLYSFNFLNPQSGRSIFRQSAADTITLIRMLSSGNLDIEEGQTEYEGNIQFDPSQIHFFGHSQGGLSGALVLGVEPLVLSAVISGAGGVLLETLLRRKDVVDFEALVRNLLEVPEKTFNAFHPAMSLIQMLVDVTDPVNYAQYWLNPAEGGSPKHVFITEGVHDAATPAITTHALAAAARVPILEPMVMESDAHVLRGLANIAMPVYENMMNEQGQMRTAGLKQWDSDHFAAFTETEARTMWQNWFEALFAGFSPQLKP